MIKTAYKKTFNSIKTAMPIIIGILMIINLLNPLIEKYYYKVFTNNYIIDPLVGAILGSISFGIPIISYVTGGELLKHGISLLAVTAFIMTWGTVGIAMLPLEISYLGKKFAIIRNILNFFSSLIIAILTVLILKIV